MGSAGPRASTERWGETGVGAMDMVGALLLLADELVGIPVEMSSRPPTRYEGAVPAAINRLTVLLERPRTDCRDLRRRSIPRRVRPWLPPMPCEFPRVRQGPHPDDSRCPTGVDSNGQGWTRVARFVPPRVR